MPIPLLTAFALVALAAVAAWWMLRAQYRRERASWHTEKETLQRQQLAQTAELQHHASAAERERIYRDLHDDLGAQLLDLVYSAPTPEYADRVRATLGHLRKIVSDAQRPATSLPLLLTELQAETERRLESAGKVLRWEQDPALPDAMLDQSATLHLSRILREAVTNALRHAELTRLRVRFYEVDRTLLCDVTDDGEFDATRLGSGTGTQSMQHRARQLGASIAWREGTWGGTKVTMRMPLPRIQNPARD